MAVPDVNQTKLENAINLKTAKLQCFLAVKKYAPVQKLRNDIRDKLRI